MARFPIVSEQAAQEPVAEVLVDFRQKMGFPAAPNFIRAQAASPDVMRGTWGLVRNVLVEGRLPRTLKEMVFVAISRDRHCNYCEAAHVACCRMLGVDEDSIKALVEDNEYGIPERTRDIISFAVKCARDPQSLEVSDFDTLRSHGLGDPELTELIAMSGLAVYANTLADAIQVDPDPMFFESDTSEADS